MYKVIVEQGGDNMITVNKNASIDICMADETYYKASIDNVVTYLRDELKLVLDGVILESRVNIHDDYYAYEIYSKRLGALGLITVNDLKTLQIGGIVKIFLHTPDREEHQMLQRLGY